MLAGITGVGMLAGTIGAGTWVIKTLASGTLISTMLGNLHTDTLETFTEILTIDAMDPTLMVIEILEVEIWVIERKVCRAEVH